MRQFRNFGDKRQVANCVYCGGQIETRDHVPSKVFLDQPYPENLPIVYACYRCNQGFSSDEEYVACLIECARTDAIDGQNIQREEIKRILRRAPALAARLANARYELEGTTYWKPEPERLRAVVRKLARGHAAFELNEPQFDEPSSVEFEPLHSLSDAMRRNFETPPRATVWPEVGSRGMQRVVLESGSQDWIFVQPGRYRFLASAGQRIDIRMVLSDYLVCEVIWA